MKRIILYLALLLLTACAQLGVSSQNAALRNAYDSVDAYVQIVATSLVRGRMTADQAERANANAKRARESINTAREALAACDPQKPCTTYEGLMRALQPALIEFERERSAQGAQK